MKKKIAILLAAVMMLALAGCGQGGAAKNHVVDYKVDIPEGFVEAQMEGLDAYWQNTADSSNINLTITDKTSGFSKISADMVKSALMTQFEAAGFKATINDRYFNKDQVCGLPAYQYCYDISLNGVDMIQLIVCIDADQAYTFTYTDVTGDWLATFENSAKNIQLTLE